MPIAPNSPHQVHYQISTFVHCTTFDKKTKKPQLRSAQLLRTTSASTGACVRACVQYSTGCVFVRWCVQYERVADFISTYTCTTSFYPTDFPFQNPTYRGQFMRLAW